MHTRHVPRDHTRHHHPTRGPSALPAAALAAALGVQDEVGLALEVAAGGHLLLLRPALHVLLFLNRE